MPIARRERLVTLGGVTIALGILLTGSQSQSQANRFSQFWQGCYEGASQKVDGPTAEQLCDCAVGELARRFPTPDEQIAYQMRMLYGEMGPAIQASNACAAQMAAAAAGASGISRPLVGEWTRTLDEGYGNTSCRSEGSEAFATDPCRRQRELFGSKRQVLVCSYLAGANTKKRQSAIIWQGKVPDDIRSYDPEGETAFPAIVEAGAEHCPASLDEVEALRRH